MLKGAVLTLTTDLYFMCITYMTLCLKEIRLLLVCWPHASGINFHVIQLHVT